MKAENLEKLIATTGDLPAIPAIAVKVMGLVGDPSTSARSLQDIITRDQALTTKVLKIANSAMFGVSRDISTLSHAIVLLGFASIRSIVLATSTKSIYMKGRNVAGFSTKLLWDHSLASALVSRKIAEYLDDVNLEEAFIAGLLHDIGKTVMNYNFGETYEKVIKEVYNSKVDFLPIEQDVLGFDHTQIGALVIRKWNLSRELEDAVLHHHSPQDSEENRNLTATVSLANALCNSLGIGPQKKQDFDSEVMNSSQILKFDESRLEKILENITEMLEVDRVLFDV